MSQEDQRLEDIINAQRKFFRTNITFDIKWRIEQLKRLKQVVIAHEEEIERALFQDLGRTKVESYICDIGPTISEINEMISGLKRWSKPETHFSGWICFPSTITKVYKMPYGVTLIVSPFNFPFVLSLGVLAACISGGNTAVIKASSKSPACTAELQKIIAEAFPSEYVNVLDGGHDVADACLMQRFDKIFYTGSPAVGKHVMAKAAINLIPIAMELGGETGNWCIIRKDADIQDAARKIAFFKSCNSGQICININQIAVAEEIAEQFIEALKFEFIRQVTAVAENNKDYSHLINDDAFKKCEAITNEYSSKVVFGGRGDMISKRFAPTIIYPVSHNDKIVKHELFSPILPIVPFKDSEVSSILDAIAEREHPLALYLFTKDKKWAKSVMSTLQFGGGCINEVGIHHMVKGAPFNGVGHSGMGAYHGVWGFREFTHPQTVLFGRRWFNLSLREHPYTGKYEKIKLAILRKLEK